MRTPEEVNGGVAQSVEHGTHNPSVAGSIPALTTKSHRRGPVAYRCVLKGKELVIKVLKVDAGGTPQSWLTQEQAASLLFSNDVAWSTGQTIARLHGGWNSMGERSFLDIPAVIGTRGKASINLADCTPSLGRHSNQLLFERDRHLCAYCGVEFKREILTRDHVLPLSRGGKDEWTNVVAACGRCNSHKAAKTPEEAKMPLLYVPYKPNWFEGFILQQGSRKILADQMDFLINRIPAHSRVLLQ